MLDQGGCIRNGSGGNMRAMASTKDTEANEPRPTEPRPGEPAPGQPRPGEQPRPPEPAQNAAADAEEARRKGAA